MILSAPVPGDELDLAPLPDDEAGAGSLPGVLATAVLPERNGSGPAWARGVTAEPPWERVPAGAARFPAPRPAETGQVVELRGGEEFWRNRPDENDADTVVTVRTVARVGLLVGVGLLVAGLAWSGLNARQRMPMVNEMSAPGPATTPAPEGRPSSGPAVAVPPPADPAPSPSATTAPTATESRRAQTDPTVAGTMSPADSSGDRSVPGTMRRDETGRPRSTPTRRAALPRPRPPVAALSPASVKLGARRTGTFTLACGSGTCRVTSATGSGGIVVSGRSFRVKAPASRPACPGPPVTRTGTIVIRWAGVARGDGRTTAGTATSGGTFRLRVSWTVARDPGAYVQDSQGGGSWTNCSRY